MTLLWTLLGVLVVVAGLAYRIRIRAIRRQAWSGGIDDEGVRRILEEGRFSQEDAEKLDLKEIAEAEEEFWDESWDAPEEYRP